MPTTLQSLLPHDDADLISLLEAEGHETVESVRDAGRDHWVSFFADRDGFQRDFVGLLEEVGLTWEEAASAERFQCPVYELEIGTAAAQVAESLGGENFADVFRRSRDEVRLAMARRSGMLDALDALVTRAGLPW
ncbi:MAG: hypothetical protein R3A52_27135 [Polyangiales bacterium]